MDAVWQDIKYGFRILFKDPAFTAVAVLTLALGIGATAAIFSVVNAVMLRPLPFRDPDRVVQVLIDRAPGAPTGGFDTLPLPRDDVLPVREQSDTTLGLGLIENQDYTLTGFSTPVRLNAARVSPTLLRTLGIVPILGRVFEDDEETPGNDRVALLGETLWQRQFESDPDILGRVITLDDDPYTVVGVFGSDLNFPQPETELWVPVALSPASERVQGRVAVTGPAIARLADGVSIEQATAEMNTIFRRLYPPVSAANVGPQGQGRGRGETPNAPGEPGPGEGGTAVARGGPGGPGRGEGGTAVARGGPGGPGPGEDGTAVARGGPGGRGGQGGPGGRGRGQGPGGRGGGPGGNPMADATVRLVPFQEQLTNDVRPALLVLMGAVSLVLLIACANVANLLLTRASGRSMEMGVRVALGAGRFRILRQVFTESMVLAITGGVLGVVFAYGGVRALNVIQPGTIPRVESVNIDATVLVFTLGIALLTGLVFGLVPAFRLSSYERTEALKEGRTLAAGGRTRGILVMTEVALAVVLLIGGGLLIGSFTNLASIDPGYDPENVLTFSMDLPETRYAEHPQRRAFYDQLLQRIREMNGVETAGATSAVPLVDEIIRLGFRLPGETEPLFTDLRIVTPGYLETMGIELIEGRSQTDQDRNGLIVVNQEFASSYFPEGALGQQFQLGPLGNLEIIGVAGNILNQGLEGTPQPGVYINYAEVGATGIAGIGLMIAVKTTGEPSNLIGSVRTAVLDIDPSIPLDDVRTMEERLYSSVAQPRFYAILLGIFAGLALVLASVGIYGVLAYSVAQRTREIGIRMALGAQKTKILGMIVSQGMFLTLIGIVAGLLGAFALTRYLESLLFGLTSLDPVTFSGMTLILIVTAMVACYLPARRATRVDPIDALRHE